MNTISLDKLRQMVNLALREEKQMQEQESHNEPKDEEKKPKVDLKSLFVKALQEIKDKDFPNLQEKEDLKTPAIEGIYLFEGEEYSVKVSKEGVQAFNAFGVPVAPIEIVFRGKLILSR